MQTDVDARTCGAAWSSHRRIRHICRFKQIVLRFRPYRNCGRHPAFAHDALQSPRNCVKSFDRRMPFRKENCHERRPAIRTERLQDEWSGDSVSTDHDTRSNSSLYVRDRHRDSPRHYPIRRPVGRDRFERRGDLQDSHRARKAWSCHPTGRARSPSPAAPIR